ncbi:MAG: hypothetical protein NVS1B7_1700 [Candidatus Saccharimonadales bacterium]
MESSLDPDSKDWLHKQDSTQPTADNMSVYDNDPLNTRISNNKAISPDNLLNAEAGGVAPSPHVGLAEKNALGSSVDKNSQLFNFNPIDNSMTGLEKVKHLVAQNLTKKRALIGGGLGGIIVALIVSSIGIGSFELVHVRENLLGHNGNPLQNLSLKNRRARAINHVIKYYVCKNNPSKCVSAGGAPSTAAAEEVTANVSEQGITKALNEQGFKADLAKGEISYADKPPLDLAVADIDKEMGSYVSNVSKDAPQAFENVAGPATEEMWTGEPAIGLYARLKTGLNNWVDSAMQKVKPGETPDQQASRIAQEAEAASDAVSVQALEGADKIAADRGLPANDVGKVNNTATITEGAQPADYNALADEASAALDKTAGRTLESAAPELVKSIGLKGVLEGSAAAIDPLLTVQTVCKAKGVLQYVANIRNVLLAIELSRFAVRYLSAADHNKAGILTSDGLKVLMLYLHRPGRKGETYLQSGGMQHLLGNKTAIVEAKNQTTFSTANANTGIFSQAANLLGSVPTFNVGCSLASNGLVNLGVGAVGAVVAVAGGSEFGLTEASGFIGVAARILAQIIFEIAKPFIVNIFFHQVMPHAIGTGIGDGLASGFGASRAMQGQVNGLRATPKAEASKLAEIENLHFQKIQSSKSLFDRYLATSNVDSFVSRVGLMLPSNPVATIMSKVANPFGNLLNATVLTSQIAAATRANTSVYAAEQEQNSQCNLDTQIQATGVATDAFCNVEVASTPLLDIDQTKQILLSHTEVVKQIVKDKCVDITVPAPLIKNDGSPISYPNGAPSCQDPGVVHMSDDIKDYIAKCFSGRPNILYDDTVLKKDDGSAGKAKAASILEHEPYADYIQPCVNSGDPLSNEVSPGVGRFLRYATWYGYMNDLQNLSSQLK